VGKPKDSSKPVNSLLNRQTRALIFDGQALLVLLRDDNQIRMFITLAMYCDLLIGADVIPELKG